MFFKETQSSNIPSNGNLYGVFRSPILRLANIPSILFNLIHPLNIVLGIFQSLHSNPENTLTAYLSIGAIFVNMFSILDKYI